MSISVPALASTHPSRSSLLWGATYIVFVLFVFSFLFLVIASALMTSSSYWSSVEQGVEGVVVGDVKETREYGEIAVVEYYYDGMQRKEMARVSVDAFVGGETAIVVDKATGEAKNDWPQPEKMIAGMTFLSALILTIGLFVISWIRIQWEYNRSVS